MPKPARLRQLSACLLLVAGLACPAGAEQAQDDSDLELGKQVFLEIAQPACATCHTLADADATGVIGPNLDELQPSEERVETAVRQGVGVMPAFGDILTDEQIEAVAHYVATVTGQQ